MSPSEPNLVPHRSWDELIATSRRRGTSLRRRRRALLSAPPLAVVVLMSGLSWVPLAQPQQDRVVTDVAEVPDTATAAPEANDAEAPPAPAPPDGGTAPAPAPAGGRTSGGTGSSARAGGAPKTVVRPPSIRPVPGRPPAASAPAEPAVTFSDMKFDARATRDSEAVYTQSRDEYDIVEMRLTAGGRGVSVEMLVLGEPSEYGAYYALLTDASTGCTLKVLMRVDDRDSFTVACPASPVSSRVNLAPTADEGSTLRAFVPYEAFPRSVSPDRPLALGAETWDDPPGPPPAPGAADPSANVVRYDTAETDQKLSRRRR